MAVHEWTCGNGHTFVFGNEDWHADLNQGLLPDGAPIPMYCTADEDDEPCMDSSQLIDDGVKR